MPVVERDQVDRPALCAPRLERSASQQREAARIVRVVAGRIAVEAGPAERTRVLDEPEAVAVRVERANRHVADPAGRHRIGNPDLQHVDDRPRGDRDAGYRGRNTSTGPSTAPGTLPSARASASTTSARPPVLANGSHSAPTKITRMGGDGSRAIEPLPLTGSRRECPPV